MAQGAANTPLGLYIGVDFAIQSVHYDLDEPWRGRAKRGEISEADLQFAVRGYLNVVSQIVIRIKPVKLAGRVA